VTAVSADEAAALLAARFAAPGSSGARQLLQHVLTAAALTAPPQQQRVREEEESLAAALASVPERAAAVELPQLQPGAFVPAVTTQLMDLLIEQQEQLGEGGAAGRMGATFVADVLGRFCRRGHQQPAAAALLQCLQHGHQRAAVASSIVAAIPDSAALDKLLEAVLKGAAGVSSAASAAASANCSQAARPLPLNTSPAEDPTAQAVAGVLSSLLPPVVWQTRADARLLLMDKLLVQQQRRLLPLAALRGLLLFLQRQQAADSSSSRGLLPDAAARVALLWGDAGAVQRLAAQQQAYLTAALCCCLALASRQQLDGHPQLLPLLLSGITTRLESPLEVCAVRVCSLIVWWSPWCLPAASWALLACRYVPSRALPTPFPVHLYAVCAAAGDAGGSGTVCAARPFQASHVWRGSPAAGVIA
jgi:hypothetical protein